MSLQYVTASWRVPVTRLRAGNGHQFQNAIWRTGSFGRLTSDQSVLRPSSRWVQDRGAKTVSRRKLKDLEQGALSVSPDAVSSDNDAPEYPTVLQGVKNNMIKFDKCVLLTRVGNFYELYFEHAEEYGPILGLKVSSRRTSLGPVAMAGFPFFQLERFLKMLVEDLSKHVAISEEFPTSLSTRPKTGGLLFDRKVARVVTPGTLIDEKFLNPLRNNFLLAMHVGDAPPDESTDRLDSPVEVGLAWLDLSTGDFFTQATSRALLPATLLKIGAREILLSQNVPQEVYNDVAHVLGQAKELMTFHEATTNFEDMSAWNSMLESPARPELEQTFTSVEKLSGHLLLDYVRSNLQGSDFFLRQPQRRQANETLNLDRSGLRGLEILETSRDGFGKGSLFHAVRRTVTNGGARLLRERLVYPSASLHEINTRLALVTYFFLEEPLCEIVVAHLRKISDVKRLIQKFTLNKGNADDMLSLAKSIAETQQIAELLRDGQQRRSDFSTVHENFSYDMQSLDVVLEKLSLAGPHELSELILSTIDEEGLNRKHQFEEDEATEVAIMAQDVVKTSAPQELAHLPKDVRTKARSEPRDFAIDNEDLWVMRRHSSEVLSRLHEDLEDLKSNKDLLQQELRGKLSASTLTLKWTPGLGHICHIKGTGNSIKGQLEEMNARMVSSSKSTKSFYLAQWSQLGNQIDQMRMRIRAEEQQLFDKLRKQVVENIVHLRRNASVIEELDVATSFATLAHEQKWTRPLLHEGTQHKVIGGRHPTVKMGLEEKGRSFVSNDLCLDENERAWIITGPNMAGKSTFLRQNALIIILAQAGSYVPAEYAEIGIVDKIFCRIGAADDLFRDQSTFMVEMLETAAILKHATSRSFVIMDEVGRGTTPEDGTAVAFASLHHMYHHNRCRTLFATHFHAIHDMTKDWSHVGRYCTDVSETDSASFSFVHKLKPGINRQSHALKVARIAGLPDLAIETARSVIKEFEEKQT